MSHFAFLLVFFFFILVVVLFFSGLNFRPFKQQTKLRARQTLTDLNIIGTISIIYFLFFPVNCITNWGKESISRGESKLEQTKAPCICSQFTNRWTLIYERNSWICLNPVMFLFCLKNWNQITLISFVYFRSLFDELEQKWKSLDDVAENDPDFLQPYRFVSTFSSISLVNYFWLMR